MRQLFRLTVLLPFLAGLALGLAAIGWAVQGTPNSDIPFKILPVLSLGGDYGDSAKWAGNAWIELARWIGFIFFVLTAGKALRLLLARQWHELQAQILRPDIVLIGNDPVLAGLAKALSGRRRVLLIGQADNGDAGRACIIATTWKSGLVRRYRLAEARATIIAVADGALHALTVARDLGEPVADGEIAILTSGLGARASLALSAGFTDVRVLAPDQLALRALHEGYPLFEVARQHGQGRLHILILGGDVAEQIIGECLLSARTTFLEQPRFTLIAAEAEAIRHRMTVQSPELDAVCNLAFVTPPHAGTEFGFGLPLDAVRKAFAQDPFTAVYVCLGNDAASLATALAWDDAARRHDWSTDALFVHQRDVPDRQTDTSGAFGRLIPFGTSEQIADTLGLLGGGDDRIARRLHEAYRRAAPPTAPANVPWQRLPETLRNANRRGISHLPAKLASAGAALDTWSEARRRHMPAELPPFPDLTEDTALLGRLAELEHERWMAERLLNGWTYGRIRDDARRIHPDLIPFAQLSPQTQDYDANVIHTLAAVLAEPRAATGR